MFFIGKILCLYFWRGRGSIEKYVGGNADLFCFLINGRFFFLFYFRLGGGGGGSGGSGEHVGGGESGVSSYLELT